MLLRVLRAERRLGRYVRAEDVQGRSRVPMRIARTAMLVIALVGGPFLPPERASMHWVQPQQRSWGFFSS